MKRRLFACVIAVATAATAATMALAGGNGAGKVPLYEGSFGDCINGAFPTVVKGFVVFNVPGEPGSPPPREITATISLEKAVPNTTYGVFLYQDPGDCPFTDFEEEFLETNGEGNGTVQVSEPWNGVAVRFLVLLQEGFVPGPGGRYLSPTVTLQ